MKSSEIVQKAKFLADQKTIYIRGSKGHKMSQGMKLKYASSDPFNAKRTKLIFDASEDTLGIDEYGFFSKVTEYHCRNIGEIIALCNDISKDFNSIVPGEIVFAQDRFGIFVGLLSVVVCDVNGIHYADVRDFVSHGKLGDVTYERETDSNVELRTDRVGSGDRVQQVSSQNRRHDRDHGRRKSENMQVLQRSNETDNSGASESDEG